MNRSATIATVVAMTLAAGCDHPAGEGSAADQEKQKPYMDPVVLPDKGTPATELHVTQVTLDPDPLVDSSVTVVGEVEEMLGARAFKLNDEEPAREGIDDDLVVLGTERTNWTMDDSKGDARMRVKGKVQRVPTADLERQLGWDLSDTMQEAIKNEKVVIIAESVERIEGEPQRAREGGDERKGAEREDVRGEDEPATR